MFFLELFAAAKCLNHKGRLMKLDDSIIRRLQAGETEALRVIYELSGDKVFHTALGILGNRQDAEDATQDIFLRLYRKARSFDFRASFSTWLYRLAVNHCLNILRRRRVLRWLPLVDTVATTREEEKRQARIEAQDLLCRLDPRARSFLVLRELQGLSYSEIAEIMSVPVGTVRSSLSRARVELAAAARCSLLPPSRFQRTSPMRGSAPKGYGGQAVARRSSKK